VLSLQSDERLVALAHTGHERAFAAIVERYRKPLVRYCGRLLPASRAEDAVQQAFISAHAALTRGDDVVDLKPWLYKITRNTALNMVRQNGWNYEQIPLDFDGVRRPDQVVEQREQLDATVAALNELPDRQRDAIVMREFEGRSYNEIARRLDAGDGAVRQLLNRARATLRAAATALTPPPLLLRIAEITPSGGGNGSRVAEVVGGLGAAGIAKAGATAMVAGTLVVGAVNAPLPVKRHGGARHEALVGTANASPPAAAVVNVSSNKTTAPAQSPRHSATKRSASGGNGSGGGHGRRGSGTNQSAGGQGEDDHSGRRHGRDEPDDSKKKAERAPAVHGDDEPEKPEPSDDAVPDDAAAASPERHELPKPEGSGKPPERPEPHEPEAPEPPEPADPLKD
jgi:RNA polymerase sigma factor (sigma-70 family)